MLLHVIVPAFPINFPNNRFTNIERFLADHVVNGIFAFALHIHDMFVV